MSEAPVLRLKMTLATLKHVCDSSGEKTAEELVFTCAYGPKGSANEQWCKWTPSGNLAFTISNPAAFGKVLPGQFYFVDLISTDKDAL